MSYNLFEGELCILGSPQMLQLLTSPSIPLLNLFCFFLDHDPMIHSLIETLKDFTMPSFSFTNDDFSHTFTARTDFKKMRVFLVQTAKGLFSSSGGYKANLCLLRYLAWRGHAVTQLCYSHREEVEKYTETMMASGSHDPQLRTKLLHLRADKGRPAIDVKVHELIMQDGIRVVTLESEAFDAAFGGKGNVHQEMARETMEYIEVIH